MDTTTVAVDLAKDVFEVAVAGAAVKRQRLSRAAFGRFLVHQPRSRIAMEACGSAHHWARLASSHGHEVRLLPAQYVKPYRRRNKTDQADCSALLEALKNPEILPVPVKSVDQQVIQSLHRIRSGWMSARTAHINALRGLLREFGLVLPMGTTALKRVPELIEALPVALKPALLELLDEIRELEQRAGAVEQELARIGKQNTSVQRLQQISGIGTLTATAMVASAGDAHHFKSARHFASWLGLTPREYSSGAIRRLGRLSKRGDVYVRMLLTHGARSVLTRARQLQATKPHALNHLQRWALAVQERRGYNKATCAIANKLARIAWATWYHERDFNPNHAALAA